MLQAKNGIPDSATTLEIKDIEGRSHLGMLLYNEPNSVTLTETGSGYMGINIADIQRKERVYVLYFGPFSKIYKK